MVCNPSCLHLRTRTHEPFTPAPQVQVPLLLQVQLSNHGSISSDFQAPDKKDIRVACAVGSGSGSIDFCATSAGAVVVAGAAVEPWVNPKRLFKIKDLRVACATVSDASIVDGNSDALDL